MTKRERFMALMLTAGGLGHMRPASGTWGSTPPPAIVLLLILILGGDGLSRTDHAVINGALVFLCLAFSAACIAGGTWAEGRWGKKDPGQVVADEVAGQAIALLALPWRGDWRGDGFLHDVLLAGGAFLAFRIFDILKPPPANQLQRLRAGWGILVDDLFAGAYALLVVQLVVRMVA